MQANSNKKTDDEIDFTSLFLKTIQNESEFLKNFSALMETITSKKYYSKYQKKFIDIIKTVIKDKKIESKQKFLALLLLKEGLDTKEIFMIDYVRIKIIPRLKIYGEFNYNKQKDLYKVNPVTQEIEDTRGRLIFGKIVDKDYSQQFYQLNLELLKHWNDVFYKKYQLKEYKQVYDGLVKKNVIFPQQFYLADYDQYDGATVLGWQTSLEFLDRIKYLLISLHAISKLPKDFDHGLNNTTHVNAYFDLSRVQYTQECNETMINQSAILDTSDIFQTNEYMHDQQVLQQQKGQEVRRILMKQENEDLDNIMSSLKVRDNLKEKQQQQIEQQVQQLESLREQQEEERQLMEQQQEELIQQQKYQHDQSVIHEQNVQQLQQESENNKEEYKQQQDLVVELQDQIKQKNEQRQAQLLQLYRHQQDLQQQQTQLHQHQQKIQVYEAQLQQNTELLEMQQEAIGQVSEQAEHKENLQRDLLQDIYQKQSETYNNFLLKFNYKQDNLEKKFHLLQKKQQLVQNKLLQRQQQQQQNLEQSQRQQSHMQDSKVSQNSQQVHIYQENDPRVQFYKDNYEKSQLEVANYKTAVRNLENQLKLKSDMANLQQNQIVRLNQQKLSNQTTLQGRSLEDQKVIDQLWATVDCKNQEIEKYKIMASKNLEQNQEDGDLVGIEKEFQDIYGRLKKLQTEDQK